MKLHPQNETPGGDQSSVGLEPVTTKDLLDLIEIIYLEMELLRKDGLSYHMPSIRKRIELLKERL